MDDELVKTKRLVALLGELETLERVRLSEINRGIVSLQESQAELMNSLNGNAALHGLFVDVLANRVRSLNKSIEMLGQERVAATSRLQACVLRSQHVGKMLRRVKTNSALRKQKIELDALLDWIVTMGPQGLGKPYGSG